MVGTNRQLVSQTGRIAKPTIPHPTTMTFLMPAACFVFALLLMAAINGLQLRPWLKSEGKHWSERARILWPIRKTNSILMLYAPMVIALASKFVADASMLGLTPRWFAALLGATAANWLIAKNLHPNVQYKDWVKNIISGIAKLGYWGIIVVAIAMMPKEFNLRTWLTFAAAGALLILWSFVSLWILRMLRILRPAGKRLQGIVASCTNENTPKVRNVWEAPSIAANVFALPYNQSLIFLDPLLENLTDDEVASICSHEIGHLAESVPVIAARLAASIYFLPLTLMQPAIHQLEISGFFLIMVAMMAWARIFTKLSHRFEMKADATASAHQTSEGCYARALEKIHQFNHLPAIMPGKNNTHPNLYDRMMSADSPPKFPPPRRPRSYTALGWFVIFGAPASLFIIATILFD